MSVKLPGCCCDEMKTDLFSLRVKDLKHNVLLVAENHAQRPPIKRSCEINGPAR